MIANLDNPEYVNMILEEMKPMKVLLYMNPDIAYQMIRSQITNIINSDKYKPLTTCGSSVNCSFCCHDKIVMGRVEADYIKRVIAQEKIVPNKHRVEVRNNSSSIKWIDKACPMLLDENEKGQRLCSIYEDRPLICRTHNSSVDPKECDRELYPKKSVREVKSAILDAFSFTNFSLGQNPSNNIKDTTVSMHEALREMGF